VDLKFAGIDPDEVRTRLRTVATTMGLSYDAIDHMSGAGRGLLKRYARAAVVVSSRLHGAIFAAALRKPLLAIECDRKMGAFLDTHAPRTPRANARSLNAAIQANALAAIVDGFAPYDYEQAMAANRTKMREIASTLERG
jgi:polysaccharide pyruvyl transferase WcaK-like protein